MRASMRPLLTLLLAAALGTLPLAAAQAAEDVLIVYDASGSMWGQIAGVNKITTAREVMADLVRGWPADTHLGLVAYGHRSAGDCNDIETLIAPQPVDREAFIDTVNAINPKGKTPISASLRHAADVLQYRDNNATVVLISDGLESCHGDPCAVAAELKERGVDFTAHVVGFDLDEQGNQALACIADNTGGIFVPASNANELKDALQQVQAKVVQKEAVPEPEPTPEPESQPAEPEYDVGISAPGQVMVGTVLEVQWSSVVNARDRYTMVPAGADEGKLAEWHEVGNSTQGKLTAPGTPGLYEVRYVLNSGRKTLASAQVEVVAAEVSVSAPDTARAGGPIEVSWSQVINPRDRYTMVPTGADEGKLAEWHDVGNSTQGKLTAPGMPGLYEVRYVLNSGRKTLGRALVEVIEANATLDSGAGLQAPANAQPGETITVSWSGGSDGKDQRVALAKADAADFTWIAAHKVGEQKSQPFTLPDEAGRYEVRYLDVSNTSVLGRAIVEVK